MKRLLITGASGFLGWHCCHHENKGWEVIGTSTTATNILPPNLPKYSLDLTDQNGLWAAIKEVKPDAIFHLAAHSGTNYCEKHPEAARSLNVTATTHLAEMCADRKIKLLFTSSEQVFDGEKGSYVESDQPNPRNKYGEQKLEAENAIQKVIPEAIIVRIAVLYGKSSNTSANFLTQWLDAWGKSLSITAFYDEVRQFLSAKNCTESFFHLLEQGAEGIFHLGGREPMDRYQFANLIKDILCLENAKIIKKSQKEIKMDAFRPADLSLVCSKIKGTGFKLATSTEELRRLKPNINIKPSIFLN